MVAVLYIIMSLDVEPLDVEPLNVEPLDGEPFRGIHWLDETFGSFKDVL